MPHLKVMMPRTDCCAKCEKFRIQITNALTEDEKLTANVNFGNHLAVAQREREHYQEATRKAKDELTLSPDLGTPGAHAACSSDLRCVHYTFDYAQQVTLPCQSRQVGPLYFKVPYRVQLFGICNEAVPLQTNYLFGEEDTIGPNGTKSHGPNSVVSCLHHFFSEHGLGEKKCCLHADNCAGQNKNKTMLAYLSWRTIVGLHEDIELSFMVAGHTRCLVDGCFGMVKRKYRRSDCDTISELAQVVNESAKCNKAQLVRNQTTRDMAVKWYSWDTHLGQFFKPLKGISKFHHFEFSKKKPGYVLAREHADGEKVDICLVKNVPDLAAFTKDALPPILVPPGITAERKNYLWTQVREYCRDPRLMDPILQ